MRFLGRMVGKPEATHLEHVAYSYAASRINDLNGRTSKFGRLHACVTKDLSVPGSRAHSPKTHKRGCSCGCNKRGKNGSQFLVSDLNSRINVHVRKSR